MYARPHTIELSRAIAPVKVDVISYERQVHYLVADFGWEREVGEFHRVLRSRKIEGIGGFLTGWDNGRHLSEWRLCDLKSGKQYCIRLGGFSIRRNENFRRIGRQESSSLGEEDFDSSDCAKHMVRSM